MCGRAEQQPLKQKNETYGRGRAGFARPPQCASAASTSFRVTNTGIPPARRVRILVSQPLDFRAALSFGFCRPVVRFCSPFELSSPTQNARDRLLNDSLRYLRFAAFITKKTRSDLCRRHARNSIFV